MLHCFKSTKAYTISPSMDALTSAVKPRLLLRSSASVIGVLGSIRGFSKKGCGAILECTFKSFGVLRCIHDHVRRPAAAGAVAKLGGGRRGGAHGANLELVTWRDSASGGKEKQSNAGCDEGCKAA